MFFKSKVPMVYAVVAVDKANNIEVFKTTNHAKMLATVRKVSAEQKQYKVLRQAIGN